MKNRSAVLAAVAVMMLAAAPVLAGEAIPPAVSAAINDANRPEADKERDALRKPDVLLTFAGIKSGDKVLELVPGQGYVTRLLAKTVGPSGHVYVANMPTLNERFKTGVDPIIANPAYGNVTKLEQPFAELRAPEAVDVVWTSENYHDFKNMGMFATDTNAMNRAIFAALRPGGAYVITDYVAAGGSGTQETQRLHRIDPEVIKREVTAAGFVLEAESNALMNPADDLTARSNQSSSQVLYRFRKPG